MVSTPTLLAAGVSLISGLVYLFVGSIVRGRETASEARRANDLFALWWISIGWLTIIFSLFRVFAAFNYHDLPVYVTLLYVALLLICLALWGLAYYLFFVYLGDPRWFQRLAWFYGAFYIFLLYAFIRAGPVGLVSDPWQIRFVYQREIAEVTWIRYTLLLLSVPQILGAFGYFSLLFRTQVPLHRYRIAIVSGSIFIWFGTSFVLSALRLDQTSWAPPLNQTLSLLAALLVLLAFRPPQFIQRTLGGAAHA